MLRFRDVASFLLKTVTMYLLHTKFEDVPVGVDCQSSNNKDSRLIFLIITFELTQRYDHRTSTPQRHSQVDRRTDDISAFCTMLYISEMMLICLSPHNRDVNTTVWNSSARLSLFLFLSTAITDPRPGHDFGNVKSFTFDYSYWSTTNVSTPHLYCNSVTTRYF